MRDMKCTDSKWEGERRRDGNEEDDDGETHVNTETTERTLRTFSIGRATGCCLMTVECSTQQLSYQPDRRRRRRHLHLLHQHNPPEPSFSFAPILLSFIIITISYAFVLVWPPLYTVYLYVRSPPFFL